MSRNDRPQGKGERTVRLDSGFSTVTWTVEGLDWPPIESAAGVTFTPDRRKRLVEALDTYFTAKSFETMRPAAKDVDRRLDAIAHHAKGLADALGTQTTAREVAVGAVWPWSAAPEPTAVQAFLRRLAVSAKYHTADGKPGRPCKHAVRELVITARSIWHDAGGKGSGGSWDDADETVNGPLLDTIMEMIAQGADHDMAMDEESAIATAISEWKPGGASPSSNKLGGASPSF